MNKLFLLDAFALIYRAHFAFSKNPRVNSKGFNTGCILGFTNTLLDILKNEKPTHIAVVFDTPEPTFRHIEYTEYKANRDEQPEDITLSIPIIKDLLRAFEVSILEKPGFEADDVIGTIALEVGKDKDFEVFMMTPDKDYGQLVRDNVFLYKPNFMGKGVDVLGPEQICEKWGIDTVEQVIDMLGLQGDAVDNIPGVPGVGPKTASKMLKQYGSIETLLENTGDLKGKMKEKVESNKEQALLSKRLATIKTDVPIEFDVASLLKKEWNQEKIETIFDEMEFRTLKKRLFGAKEEGKGKAKKDESQIDLFSSAEEEKSEESTNKKTISDVPHDYKLVQSPEEIGLLLQELAAQEEFCFDTETTNVNAIEAELVGVSFSYQKGEAYYLPVPLDKAQATSMLEPFREVFENDAIGKVGQNLKYDIIVLSNYGIQVKGQIFDTMLAHYLIQPDMRHAMDILAENYLDYKPISIESLIGKKGKNQGNMKDVPVEKVVDYAAEDADITLQLKQKLSPEIEKLELGKLLHEVEVPLMHVLSDIERNGVKVDTEMLGLMSKDLEEGSKSLEEKIYELAGTSFNIASPKQLGEILFEHMKLDPKAKKTKTGQYATGEEVLTKLAKDHEIIDHILNFREYNKLKSTYVDALPKMISPTDGRIHTSFRQAVAATGRLSSDKPNLQNIPIRTEKGRAIRKAFVGTNDDYAIFAADYSQIELRIMAAFSKDEEMIHAFQEGRDIHATTASKVYHVPLEEVSAEQRRHAKSVNFGIIYGTTAFGLSQNLGIPRKEASQIIEAYFEEFPNIKKYMDEQVNIAKDQGYVSTILGRRRYLKDINSRNFTMRAHAERNAVNAPIQGSAADMIKVAMINIHEWMKKEQLKSKMIIQVHDELVFDAHKSELELLQQKIPVFMKDAIALEVPMEIGMGKGENWLVAH